jgi:hypothetical protein
LALAWGVLVVAGCPEKPQEGPPGKGVAAVKPTAEDPRFGKADPVESVSVDTEMSQDLQTETKGRTAGELAMAKAMSEASKFKMAVTITDDRTRMTIDGKNMPMPAGSYVVHDAPGRRYAFVEKGKDEYHLLNGAEITSLFEGGPTTGRTNYTVNVTDTAEKETVAGFDCIRSNVEVGFDWTVKFENKTKSGKTRATLVVWHTADAKLKPAWAREMIDFLTLPFQDDEGRKVADTLKARLKFPLRWRMEVVVDGLESDAKPPIITTTTTKVAVAKTPGTTFQIPPAGLKRADGPWNPGKGGAVMDEAELPKLREKEEVRRPDDTNEVPGNR